MKNFFYYGNVVLMILGCVIMMDRLSGLGFDHFITAIGAFGTTIAFVCWMGGSDE
jgi:hypothetical protein